MTPNKRGFSMLEMMVVLAIVAIVGGLSVPYMQRGIRRNMVRSTAQGVVSNLARARSLASTGPRPGSPWTATDRARNAGLVFVAANAYVVFIDRDGTSNGDEIVVKTVQLPSGMQFTAPAVGQELRFRQNGTLAAASNVMIVDNTTGFQREVVVAGGGFARVN